MAAKRTIYSRFQGILQSPSEWTRGGCRVMPLAASAAWRPTTRLANDKELFRRRSSARRRRPLHVEQFEPRWLLAWEPQLVADIDPAIEIGAYPPIATIGNEVLFAGTDAAGTELWITDGTAENTRQVVDLNPGPGSGFGGYAAVMDGDIFFNGFNPELRNGNGMDLWKTDGTPEGTQRLQEFQGRGIDVFRPVELNGELYFGNRGGGLYGGLWKTDGTVSGTQQLASLSVRDSGFVTFGDKVFFGATTSEAGSELWVSDGTPAGTELFKDLNPGTAGSFPDKLTVVDDKLFFFTREGSNDFLWVSDGTAAGTRKLRPMTPGSEWHSFIAYAGHFYFAGDDSVHGMELWKSDGTDTQPVNDVDDPDSFVIWNDTLYFVAGLNGGARLLWKTSATTQNTSPVTNRQVVGELAQFDDRLVFFARDTYKGVELWSSDGTHAGTALVKDIRPGASSSIVNLGSQPGNRDHYFLPAGNRLLFIANDGTFGPELWATDGSEAGTQLVVDIQEGRNSNIENLTAAGTNAFFSILNDNDHQELWRSDGVTTELVRDIRGRVTGYKPTLYPYQSEVYFRGHEGTSTNTELWKSDGTAANTGPIVNVSQPQGFEESAGKLFFSAVGPGSGGLAGGGVELWVYDGATNQASRVRDINPGPFNASSNPQELTDVGGTLFLTADSDSDLVPELWRSDGTEAGTVQVPLAASQPEQLTALGDKVVFTATNSSAGRELWVSNGTTSSRLGDIAPGVTGSDPSELTTAGNLLFFSADDGSSGRELWVTDGTSAGTRLVSDVFAGSESSNPEQMTLVGQEVFFAADDGIRGRELWAVDTSSWPDPLPVRRVFDINPGPVGSDPDELFSYNGLLVFSAIEDNRGRELWLSDGSEIGTVLVSDLNNVNPNASSFARDFTNVNGNLFFLGASHQYGDELWILLDSDLPTVNLQVPSTSSVNERGVVRVLGQLSEAQSTDIIQPVRFAGTATLGDDYTVEYASLFFPAGRVEGFVDLRIVEDSVLENDETIEVSLLPSGRTRLGTTTSIELTIVNDDVTPGVAFTRSSQFVQESDGTIEVGVVLSAPTNSEVTVPLTFNGTATIGNDYTVPDGTTLVVPAGQETATRQIQLIDDTDSELSERIDIQLGTPTNAILQSGPSQPLTHSIVIASSDLPSVSFTSFGRNIDESSGQISIALSLSETVSSPVDVELSFGGSASTEDFLLYPPTQVTIPANAQGTTIQVQPSDDSSAEQFEKLQMFITSVSGAAIGTHRYFNLGVKDNDLPELGFTVSSVTVSESYGVYEFTVTTDSPADYDIPITVTTSGRGNLVGLAREPQDYRLLTPDLVLASGETSITGSVAIVDEIAVESTEHFGLWLQVSPNDARVAESSRSGQHVYIKDNDASVSAYIFDAAAPFSRSWSTEFIESDREFQLVVSLSAALESELSFSAEFGGSAKLGEDLDLSPSDGVVRIPAGRRSGELTIQFHNDDAIEGNESLEINLVTTDPIPGLYTGKVRPVTLDILDNDSPPFVSFGVSKVFHVEGEDVTVPVELNRPTGTDVFVKIAFDEGTASRSGEDADYIVRGLETGDKLKIPAGETRASFSIELLSEVVLPGDQAESTELIDLKLIAVENADLGIAASRQLQVFVGNHDQTCSPPKPVPVTGYAQLVEEDYGILINGTGLLLPAAVPGDTFRCFAPFENIIQQPVNDKIQVGVLPPALANLGPGATIRRTGGLTEDQENAGYFVAIGRTFADFAGRLNDSVVFFDANLNGVQDFLDLNGNTVRDENEPFEPSVTSGADGTSTMDLARVFDRNANDIIDASEGRLVVTGGTDVTVNLPWTTQLVAPSGFFTATPITTLIASLVDSFEYAIEDAEVRVVDAMGLTGVNLRTADSYNEMIAGDEAAAAEIVAHVKLYNGVKVATEYLAGASGQSTVGLGTIVYDAIAEQIRDESSALELSDAFVLEALFSAAAARAAIDVPSSDIAGMAQIVAEGNQAIDAVPPPIGQAYGEAVSRIKKVIQGDAAAALRDVAEGTTTIEAVLSDFTGSALQARYPAAVIGDLVPPVVGVSDAILREGDSGTTSMQFFVELHGEHQQPVTVQYASADLSAVAGTDYQTVTGELTWNPGDPSRKVVDVPIMGDLDFESDEVVRLLLSDPVNTVLRVSEGYGFIINDDPASFSSLSDPPDNNDQIEVVLSQDEFLLSENGRFRSTGSFLDPLTIAIDGLAGDDQFTVDLSSSVFRADRLLVDGGVSETGDRVRWEGGSFDVITHNATDTLSGTADFDSSLGSVAPRGEYLSIDEVAYAVASVDTLIIQLPPVATSAVLEDADPTDSNLLLAGMMRLRSEGGEFAPILFTSPESLVRVVAENGASTLTTESLDPAFTGSVEFVQNSAPTDISLSADTVAENQAAGTTVGILTTTDSDSGDTFTYSLASGSGDSGNAYFAIVGDELRTAASFDFESTSSYSIRVRTTDRGSATFEKVLTVNVADTDETPPVATVQPLPLTWTTREILLNISLDDPPGAVGEPVSGVASYDVYVAVDDGGWSLLFDDVPAAQHERPFPAESNHRYWFRAVATDVAGNVEDDAALPEANTRTLDLDAPVTQVTAAVPDADTGVIALQFDGTDASGSLKEFQVLVSIDGAAPQAIVGSPVPAGSPNDDCVYMGAVSFQGLVDGNEHTYRFFTIGVDDSGNVEDPPAAPADVQVTATFASSGSLEARGIDVQSGQTQRSYVRYVDILFSDTTGVADLFPNGRVQVERFAIDTNSPTPGTGTLVTGFNAETRGNSLRLDFGSDGIGGGRDAGNGFYRISVDVDHDGLADAHFEFFRLYGDANGDGRVDSSDSVGIIEDLNGDGRVDSRDRRDAKRERGKALNQDLMPLIDD